MSAALALYRAATGLAEPLAPALLRGRMKRGKEGPERLAERLGHASRPRPQGLLAWLHGASVGEALSLLPLIGRLRCGRPDLNLLVTSGTTTSAELLARRLPDGVIHQYAPVDAPGAARRFLDAWRPDLAVFVESELWPNLLTQAHARGVRLAAVSARMSEQEARANWGGACPRSGAQAVRGLRPRPAPGRPGGGAPGRAGRPRRRPVEPEARRRSLAGRPCRPGGGAPRGGRPARCCSPPALIRARRRSRSKPSRGSRATGQSAARLVVVPRHPVRGAGVAARARLIGLFDLAALGGGLARGRGLGGGRARRASACGSVWRLRRWWAAASLRTSAGTIRWSRPARLPGHSRAAYGKLGDGVPDAGRGGRGGAGRRRRGAGPGLARRPRAAPRGEAPRRTRAPGRGGGRPGARPRRRAPAGAGRVKLHAPLVVPAQAAGAFDARPAHAAVLDLGGGDGSADRAGAARRCGRAGGLDRQSDGRRLGQDAGRARGAGPPAREGLRGARPVARLRRPARGATRGPGAGRSRTPYGRRGGRRAADAGEGWPVLGRAGPRGRRRRGGRLGRPRDRARRRPSKSRARQGPVARGGRRRDAGGRMAVRRRCGLPGRSAARAPRQGAGARRRGGRAAAARPGRSRSGIACSLRRQAGLSRAWSRPLRRRPAASSVSRAWPSRGRWRGR